MITNIKILFSLILSLAVAFGQGNEKAIERSRLLIAAKDSVDPSKVRFAGVLKSPFIHTAFYLFQYDEAIAGVHSVIAAFDDSVTLLPSITSETSYIPDPLVKFLNQRLYCEPVFHSKQLKELVKFFDEIAFEQYTCNYRLITNWHDIPLKTGERIPDSLKVLISPPEIVGKEYPSALTYFAWNWCNMRLYRVHLLCDGRQITVRTRFIGVFGEHQHRQ